MLDMRSAYFLLLLLTMATMLLLYSTFDPDQALERVWPEKGAGAKLRAIQLQEKCSELKDEIEKHLDYPPGNFNLTHVVLEAKILADLDRHFFFCKVPKSASTSWVNVLLPEYVSTSELSNMSFGFRHGMMRRVMSEMHNMSDFELIKSFPVSFLTVRHPFDRLFSAYNDKFIKHPDQPVYSAAVKFKRFNSLYGKDIIARYRQNKSDTSPELSFVEFVDYVLDSHFGEDDVHWMPIFRLCLPCHLSYGFVAKVETSDRDSREILRFLNLTNTKPTSFPETHVLKHVGSSVSKMEAFQMLSRRQLDKLYQRYHLDFKLFDYDLSKFKHLYPTK